MMSEDFKDEDYFDDENRSLKSYLIEQYEIRLKFSIENEEYEDSAKYKKLLDNLNEL